MNLSRNALKLSLVAAALGLGTLIAQQQQPAPATGSTEPASTAPMSKSELKAQHQTQKSQEKAAKEQAKADKSKEKALKHQDKATNASESAQQPK